MTAARDRHPADHVLEPADVVGVPVGEHEQVDALHAVPAQGARRAAAGPASMSTVGPPGTWSSAAAPSPTSRNVSVGLSGGRTGAGASSSDAATSAAVAAANGGQRRRSRT